MTCSKSVESENQLHLLTTEGWNIVRGLLEKYPTFGREKETSLPGALDT